MQQVVEELECIGLAPSFGIGGVYFGSEADSIWLGRSNTNGKFSVLFGGVFDQNLSRDA